MVKKGLDVEPVTEIPVINVALDTIRIGKQALVFVGTRPGAEKSAEEIAKRIDMAGKAEEVRALSKLAEDAFHALDSPTRQCDRLAKCLRKGIAFHHSGLTSRQRELVENNFRSGSVKIICCTPTLAAGVDLPAFRAIIRDLKRFTQHGYDWIPVLEYLQMAGRAGRPNFDSEGQAIILASGDGEAEELEERFINGEPEEIYSKLAVEPVLRTYLLSIIASRLAASRQEIMAFFGKTFWAHQFRDVAKLEKIIDRMLALLGSWGFITLSGKLDFVSAAELDSGRVAATLIGGRVAELYLDPLTAHNLIEGLNSSSIRGLSHFALLQLISCASELQPLLKVKVKEYADVQEKLVETQMSLLSKEPSMYDADYDEFLASVKTAMFFSDWIDENTEDVLLEKYSIRPGEVRSKLDNADWLLYSISEIARILQMKGLTGEIAKLRVRVKYGVKEELLPLLQLNGIGRVRGRRLFNNRMRTLGDVKNADVSTLTQILGSGKVALDVKRQLGQEVKEVPEGKRKGQTSITKY